jgi:hypothetical protein
LVGIASHSTEPCDVAGFAPAVFTNVGAICAWIEFEIQHLN